jgi:uncharacterized protein (DUF2345 family)
MPTEANWKGDNQLPGGEELYLVPTVSNTTDANSIGIVDGNLIALPTSYPALTLNTLTATTISGTTANITTISGTTANLTTINSTTINNSGNIQTATINGLTPSTIANTWSLFPAVNDVVARQVQATLYVPLQPYIVGEDASLGSPVYTNYECAIAGATMNPLERLDPWLEGHTYNEGVDWGCLYNGIEYITIANNVGDVLPTNTSYFRPANYDNTYGYSADDIVYQPTGISPGWYQSDNGSTGTAPPNLFAWTPITFWITAPYVPDPAWDIKGFKDVQSASVHTDELVVANQTTLGDGGDALVVNGGTTLDGGALHGTTIGSLPVSGINTVRLDVLPAGIEATSITGIIMNSTLATEIAAGGGLVLAAGGAASLAAGGALSLAGGGYIEYNTDENRFINTTSGNDFTDIKVGNIFPAHDGSANLRINGGGSGRGVEIADGVTIATQTLTADNVNVSQTTDTQLLTAAQSTFAPLLYDDTATYPYNYLVRYEDAGVILLYVALGETTGNLPTSTAYWRLAEWSNATEYNTGDLTVYSNNFYASLTNTNLDNDPAATVGVNWDLNFGQFYGLNGKGIQFKRQEGDTIVASIVKEVGDPYMYAVYSTETNLDIFRGQIFTSPASSDLNMNSNNIITVTSIEGDVDLNLNAPSGNIELTALNDIILTASEDFTLTTTLTTDIQSTGALTLNSSANGATLSAQAGVDVTSVSGSVNIASGTDISLNPTGVIDLNNKNITEANAITGTTALTLASASNGNISISPNGTGLIVATKGLNLSNNNITGANTITATTNLTLASTGTDSIRLYPASGYIECNRPILMGGASGIFQVPSINSNGTLTLTTAGGANTSPIDASNNDLQNVKGLSVLSLNGVGLSNIAVNTNMVSTSRIETSNLVLSPLVSTGRINTNVVGNPVEMNANLDFMSVNSIVNVLKINGRNLFSYGNFYNDANQTLTATNTATRVKMNTSLNNNLITLDTTTNIGRLTFTNAGVYHVVWNAYLFHGSGGTAKSVIWIRLNGTDVAGSGKTENNDSQQNETNMTSSSMVSVTASQYIEFYWAADSVNVPLTAVAASAPYPATPSFSCSISIVG